MWVEVLILLKPCVHVLMLLHLICQSWKEVHPEEPDN